MPYYSPSSARNDFGRAAGSGSGVGADPHWFAPLSQLGGGFGSSPLPQPQPLVTGSSTQTAVNQPRTEGPIPGSFPQSGPAAGAGTAGGAPGAPPPGQQSPTGPPTTGADASAPNAGTGSGNATRTAPVPPPAPAATPPVQTQPQLTPDITTQLAATPAGPQAPPVDMQALLDAVARMLAGGFTGNGPVDLNYPAPVTPAPTYNGQPLSSYPQAPAEPTYNGQPLSSYPQAPPEVANPAPTSFPAAQRGSVRTTFPANQRTPVRTTTPATQRQPVRTTTPARQPAPNVVNAQPAGVPQLGQGFATGGIPGVSSDANRAAYQNAVNKFLAGQGPPPNPAAYGLSGDAGGYAGTIAGLGGQGMGSLPGGAAQAGQGWLGNTEGFLNQLSGWAAGALG